MKKNQICFLIILLILIVLIFTRTTYSQAIDQVIISWQANNYYPADFTGKALATNKTIINATTELLINQKIQNLTDADIAWFLDGDFLYQGRGFKNINFKITKTKGDFYTLRNEIKLKDQEFEGTTLIKVFAPLTIIETPYPYYFVSAGSEIILRAVPYFFNTDSFWNLKFSWFVNEQVKKGLVDNQLVLKIGQPQTLDQKTINIAATIQNSQNPLETARQSLKLNIQ